MQASVRSLENLAAAAFLASSEAMLLWMAMYPDVTEGNIALFWARQGGA
jgi:hypothetical protein